MGVFHRGSVSGESTNLCQNARYIRPKVHMYLEQDRSRLSYGLSMAKYTSTPCIIRIHLVHNSTSARFENNPKIFT